MIDNKIYLYEMLTTNLLQAMLVRRAEQFHWQSSNNALRSHTQIKHRITMLINNKIMWLNDHVIKQWSNSEWKLTLKWSAFTYTD